MTVAVPSYTEKTWAGNGATTAFSFQTRVLEAADIKVWLVEGDTETLKSLTTHYTLAGLGADGGVTVTFLTAPPTGQTVKVRRETKAKQTVNYADLTKVPGDTTETQLDRLAMAAQDNAGRLDQLGDISDAAGLISGFNRLYLGALASDPTTDNEGDELQEGALYFNTTTGTLRVWNSGSWQDQDVAIGDEEITAPKLDPDDATGFREVITRQYETLNYFDFVPKALRANIALGTDTTTNQVTYLTAFRDALLAISDAGGRPHGEIPSCHIYTNASVNFAMDYLDLQPLGPVVFHCTTANTAIKFDGTGLGDGGFGPQFLNIGWFSGVATTGSIAVHVKHCHKSRFAGFQALGSTSRGIKIEGCVWSNFGPLTASASPTNFTATPTIGVEITGAALSQTSYCYFESIVGEDVTTGVQIDYGLGNLIASGGGERCTFGIVLTANAEANMLLKTDAEANSSFDYYCEGLYNEWHGADCAEGEILLTGTSALGNRIFGGTFKSVTCSAGANHNVGFGLVFNRTGTGAITPGLATNRFVDCYDANAGTFYDQFPWTQTTVTVASTTGTITTKSGTFRHKRIDERTYAWELSVGITTNGTGATLVRVTGIPIAPQRLYPANGTKAVGGTVTSITGSQGSATTQMDLRNADGTYPGADGAVLTLAGIMETNA